MSEKRRDQETLQKRPLIDPSADPINRAITMGINAPNPHNTQAWKFRNLSPTETLLYIDEKRILPATDPPTRQIHIGCGCFLETLAIGATGMGYATNVVYLPNGSYGLSETGRKPVARIRLDRREGLQKDEFYDYIFERQTNRKNYEGPPASDAEIEALQRSISAEDPIEFVFLKDPEEIKPLVEIFYKAMEIECRTRPLYEETRIWFRFSEKERAKKRDGLSVPAMGIAGFKKWFNELYLNNGNPSRWFSKTSINSYLKAVKKAIESSKGFGLLKTTTNNQLDWIKAGRAYSRVALSATAQGLSMQPLSQVLQEYPEMKELQAKFNQLLGVKGDEKIQMAARLGRASPPYFVYRRQVDSFRM